MDKRLLALFVFLGAAAWHWFWEFIRGLFYERGSRMLTPWIENIIPDQIISWGPTIVLPIIGIWLFWKTRPETEYRNSKPASHGPEIEIIHSQRSPYEISDIVSGRRRSAVKIGVKNTGGVTISNCKIFIDKISPEPHLFGGLPINIEGGGFMLRSGDPEQIVEIAVYWNHVGKYRFFGPPPIGLGASANYIDNIERDICIRVEALECKRSALYKIWTDDDKILHLKCLADTA